MRRLSLLLLVPLLLAAKPPPAPPPPPPEIPSVRLGVQKWQAGDYPAAVTLWTPFAANGDMDALFNLGQAYKLGRGVPQDLTVARDYYRKAATKGSLPAQANLGILLYQAGEKPEAFRWLAAAADRGETRAQYVLGVAAYNGDGVRRNVPLGYAYLLRASTAGLAQATTALAPIMSRLSYYDRANGDTIAQSLAAGQGVPPAFALFTPPQLVTQAPRGEAPAPAVTPTAPKPAPPAKIELKPQSQPALVLPPAAKPALIEPKPQPMIVSPPLAKAEPVKPEALPVRVAVSPPAIMSAPMKVDRVPPPVAAVTTMPTPEPVKPEPGKVEPGLAMAVPPPASKPIPVEAPKVTVAPSIKPAPAKPAPTENAKPEPAKATGWRVQLGAYATRAQADKVWAEVKAKQGDLVAGAKPQFEAVGGITKLQLGPLPTRDDARVLCAKLSAAGRACFITGG